MSRIIKEKEEIEEIDKIEKADRMDKIDKADRMDKIDKADRMDKIDKTDRMDKIDRADRADKIDKINKIEKTDRIDKLNKTDKIEEIEALEYALLKEWCDTLLSYQLSHRDSRFDGGILCPGCLHIHGRIIDLIYPLCYLADRTGEKAYSQAAARLFDWGENVYCDDHSYYNDAQQSWNKTTIFFAQSLMQALSAHGHVLPEKVKTLWENRLREISRWMMDHFPVEDPANLNYHASCCAALAMSAVYFGEDGYMERARALKEFCELFLSEDNFIYGEGNPRAYITKRGCKSVDIGYSLEESLPGLVEYAYLAKDETFMKRLVKIGNNYLDFILPDGGMDNSFGTRNFKWTYWGSRTSDGCLKAFTILSAYDPAFLEAGFRNLKLLSACTSGGFLYGGPDYAAQGEPPCIHHMFAHAKVLAACLDLHPEQAGAAKGPRPEQAGTDECCVFYPSLAVFKLRSGSIHSTVTAFDYSHFEGGHVSGGVMSLLYHDGYGPVLASSITDTTDREPLNRQLSLKKSGIAGSAWRFSYERDGTAYANVYDLNARLTRLQGVNGVQADFTFCDMHHNQDGDSTGLIRYTVGEEEVLWEFVFQGSQTVRLTLPVIAGCAPTFLSGDKLLFHKTGSLLLESSRKAESIRKIFSLSPGFQCQQISYAFPPGELHSLKWSFSREPRNLP